VKHFCNSRLSFEVQIFYFLITLKHLKKLSPLALTWSRKGLTRGWGAHQNLFYSQRTFKGNTILSIVTYCFDHVIPKGLSLPFPYWLVYALRWPNTVFARAFADAIQCTHKDCKNKNVVNRVIILFIQNPHFLHYFSLLLNAVYWCLYSVIIKIC